MIVRNLKHEVELEGPSGSTIEALLDIYYTHHKEGPGVGCEGGISVDSVNIMVGASRMDFNGDMNSCFIVAACWQDWLNHRESVESERAELIRWNGEPA